MIATVLTLAAAPALAANPPEPVHWTLGADDLGDYAAAEDQIIRFDSTRLRDGFVLSSAAARGHQILDGLYVPAEIGPPDAHGAKLEFVGVEDPNIRITLTDSSAGVTDVSCASPPEPVLPPDPCVAQFPAGHTIVPVSVKPHTSVFDVVMPGDDGGIIPCVRVVVQGPWAIEGESLSFAGDMHLNAQGVEDPNI